MQLWAGILFGRDYYQGISVVEQKQNPSRLIQSSWLCRFIWMLDPLVIFFFFLTTICWVWRAALLYVLHPFVMAAAPGTWALFPHVYQCLRFSLCTLRSQSKFCYFSYLDSQTYLRCISILQRGCDAGWPLLKGLHVPALLAPSPPSMRLQVCLSDPESKNSSLHSS